MAAAFEIERVLVIQWKRPSGKKGIQKTDFGQR
jgi:hypothetical protein